MTEERKSPTDLSPMQAGTAAWDMGTPRLYPVAEGDDVPFEDVKDLKMKSVAQYAAEALEVAGLAEKTADENLVTIIAAVPADGPSGTLNVVAARRVVHAIEDAGYKITK